MHLFAEGGDGRVAGSIEDEAYKILYSEQMDLYSDATAIIRSESSMDRSPPQTSTWYLMEYAKMKIKKIFICSSIVIKTKNDWNKQKH